MACSDAPVGATLAPMLSMTFRVALLMALALLALAESHSAYAANQVVSDCGDNGGANQLRAKTTAANSTGGGTISFTCGPTIVLNGSALPTITSNISIDGGNAISLSGNSASRVFVVNGGATLTLNNITITKGLGSDDGGAIYAAGTLNVNNSRFLDNQTAGVYSGGAIRADGVLNINNSEFSNNQATNGGALYVKWPNASATIISTHFHDNQTLDLTSGWGGAILVFDGATATLKHSALTANKAGIGGGLYNYYGTVILNSNSTVSGNSTPNGSDGGGLYNKGGTALLNAVTISGNAAMQVGSYGGGIHNDAGNATLVAVTLSGNRAYYGGGIGNAGTLTLTNTTVSGNQAVGLGGGLIQSSGTATLTHVTFGDNWADGYYGGIRLGAGTVALKNSLLAHGTRGSNCANVFGTFVNLGFNYSDDESCSFFGAGRTNVALYLGSLAYNGGPTRTHMPQPPSPAIDGGTGAGCPPTDQRGGSRPQGTTCDVGAVEVGAKVPFLWLPLLVR
jgi:hypothetical protein